MHFSDFEQFDILSIPGAEDDEYEFKSSLTPIKDLGRKITCAASAFANSGGGFFIAGVDSLGNADGGIPNQIGRQNVRDWADQMLRQFEPAPVYAIKLVDDPQGRGNVAANFSVIVIGVFESHARCLAPSTIGKT